MVYYRKYRPQTISDLDSAKLRETLYAVLSGNNMPHAFLFTGPKGLGKTSTARIVAKVINCEHKESKEFHASRLTRDAIEPDNTCEQCISITNGTSIDVLEIDGASNRGIDEIRELRERMNLTPSSARKKVYIIDEVHMLTTEAFNALLKTIEEPPSHVIFIFCTTEPHKVPATIISRCFHINFQLATKEEIIHSLQRIVKEEKLDVTIDILSEIAEMAEGGFRDATKILEELVALHGKEIKKEHFQKTFHTASIISSVNTLLENLCTKKTKESLEVVGNIVEQGIDIKFFIHHVLLTLHEQLLEHAGITKENSKQKTMKSSLEEVQILIELFSKAYEDTKFATIHQLPLEMAIMHYGALANEVDRHEGRSGNKFGITNGKHTMDTLLKKQKQMQVQAMLKGTPLRQDFAGQAKEPSREIHQHDMHGTPDEVTSLYENIIYKVKPLNHSIAGVLRGSTIKEITEKNIIFESAYTFHKERLEDTKTCEIIEKAVKEVTGKNLKVIVQLKKERG